jgi:hypothetical protein
MNFAIQLSICIAAWTLTLTRLRTIQWKDVRKNNAIALNAWFMMLFFSLTTIFLIKKFSNFFDMHTVNNLDRLIAYCLILAGIYFGTAATVEAVGKSSDKVTIRWLQHLLLLTVAALVTIYAFFISKIPNMDYYLPRSLPEVVFLFIAFSFAATLCAVVVKVYLIYLNQEGSAVMRTRAILIVVSTSSACAYFLVKIATVGGYFWSPLGSQALIDLSSMLLVISALLHFSALLSNKLYLPLVLLGRNIQSWGTYKDLKYLTERLNLLCPEVVLPTTNPSLLTFLLNPEYYLYSAIIAIMDGKTMLDDFLMEGALQGEPALWEGDMLREALRVKRTLQSVDASGSFWTMVSEYRRASQGLIQSRHPNLSLEPVR